MSTSGQPMPHTHPDPLEDPLSYSLESDVVDQLTNSILADQRISHLHKIKLPDREAIGRLINCIRDLVFPGFFGRRGLTEQTLRVHVQELLARAQIQSEEQIRSVLRYVNDIGPDRADCPESEECDRRARAIARHFIKELTEIRRLLALDVQAAYDGDPAAEHTDATILCYPGIDAIFSHRIAHTLYKHDVPLLPRIIQEMAHSRTGIDIHPGATIGESFFVDHGGGTVIGETTVIGNHVRIYQGVTLGAKSFARAPDGTLARSSTKRHPTIGNHVVIYAGAVILGGDTHIGDHCVVSGTTFVAESVPPKHIVMHPKSELVLRTNRDAAHIIDGGG